MLWNSLSVFIVYHADTDAEEIPFKVDCLKTCTSAQNMWVLEQNCVRTGSLTRWQGNSLIPNQSICYQNKKQMGTIALFQKRLASRMDEDISPQNSWFGDTSQLAAAAAYITGGCGRGSLHPVLVWFYLDQAAFDLVNHAYPTIRLDCYNALYIKLPLKTIQNLVDTK